ncbi:hypothetical protein NM688_g4074 [Phlebia brevispora]|uniref:Uncharacterized protein n=1 Tax=Phlebia brevispora TaxID=194682 RepID=A0ACC1T4L9_9APHY|nr:hypothetical protein NM688_g4074 [Phlebia brevispora]
MQLLPFALGLFAVPIALAQQVWEIHPGAYSDSKCVDVQGGIVANGTPVQIYDCNSSPAQQWVIQSGNTAVQLAGTDFCLDAGSSPADGVQMKIWQCYADLPAQEWYYTSDNRIALFNQGLCLDLTNGNLTDGNILQTWDCTANDINQIWFTTAGITPPPPPPEPPTPAQIHPNGNTAKCLDVAGGVFADGTAVQIYDCNGTPAQNWDFVRGSTAVQLSGTNFCIDAGSSPANGVGMKIWDCYSGLAAQSWYYTDSDQLALEGQGLCLDLTNGDVTDGNQVQTWECTFADTNQIWTSPAKRFSASKTCYVRDTVERLQLTEFESTIATEKELGMFSGAVYVLVLILCLDRDSISPGSANDTDDDCGPLLPVDEHLGRQRMWASGAQREYKLLFALGLFVAPIALAQQVWEIHPGAYSDSKCIDVQGDVVADGTPVQIYDCNGTPAQQWVIQSGNTAVQLAGTNFCLDAGSSPGNGVGMKIWQCYPDLPAQEWYYTDDNRIALFNQGLCLDLTNGDLTDGTVLQTWQCTANDINQIWTTSPGVTPPPPPEPPTVLQIHPGLNTDKCVDVRAADFADGTAVQIYDCNGTPAQNWNFVRGTTSIQVNGTNFCLDAGSSPANGTGMKIWECYSGLAAQTWQYMPDYNEFVLQGQGLSLFAYFASVFALKHSNLKGLCLDLTNGNLTDGNQLQIWECTYEDPNQVWTT